jgi:hypothetical protein
MDTKLQSPPLTAFIIGVGPNGGSYLTQESEEIVKDCGIIIGWTDTKGNLTKKIC